MKMLKIATVSEHSDVKLGGNTRGEDRLTANRAKPTKVFGQRFTIATSRFRISHS